MDDVSAAKQIISSLDLTSLNNSDTEEKIKEGQNEPIFLCICLSFIFSGLHSSVFRAV